jgi:hypothetical protein
MRKSGERVCGIRELEETQFLTPTHKFLFAWSVNKVLHGNTKRVGNAFQRGNRGHGQAALYL